MVHRDLKPHNLMLTPKGVVKILDFGLAKLASEMVKPGGGLTDTNAVMGTPQYMAPEQALKTRDADVRADIYALGCTLFHLLTGRPPFAGDEPLAIIVAHAQQAPPRLEDVRPDVPPPLAALVQRMLAKDPARRPQTPKEVADALAPFVKAAKVLPAAGAPFADMVAERPVVKPAKRRPWLPAAVAAGVVLAGIALAGVVLTFKTKDGVVTL